jgi:hypothetical protein
MRGRFMSVVRLGVAGCALMLLAGSRTNAAGIPAQPKLAGVYALQFNRYCQPNLFAQANTDMTDGDNNFFTFDSIGSIRDKIGVATFNPKTQTMTASVISIGGAVVSQNLNAISGPNDVTPFAESSGTISGPYSTTDNTFTVDPGDGATTFDAVYGAFVRGVAHVVFFVSVYNDNQGDSCAIQGQLQFK